MAFIACCINWGTEAVKWKILAAPLEYLNYRKALLSTLSGTAVSNVIPFRMGDYLGRMIFFKPENRIPAVFNSILGSSAQLMAALMFGIPAALFMLPDRYRYVVWLAVMALVTIPVILWLIFRYFSVNRPGKYAWLLKLTEDIRKFRFRDIIKVSLLSILRYWVFGLFYVWLLLQFVQDFTVPQTMAGVATVYLLQSFAPSMAITDAGLRTALPLFVFQVTPNEEAPVLAAALINYAFNILVPSVVGLGCIIAIKIRTA